jgi:hypothetical protein
MGKANSYPQSPEEPNMTKNKQASSASAVAQAKQNKTVNHPQVDNQKQ